MRFSPDHFFFSTSFILIFSFIENTEFKKPYVNHKTFMLITFLKIIFDCAGSSLLHGLFSSCGQWGLLSSCGTWASHRNGFSCCTAQALGCVGFRSCGTVGSVAVAPGI